MTKYILRKEELGLGAEATKSLNISRPWNPCFLMYWDEASNNLKPLDPSIPVKFWDNEHWTSAVNKYHQYPMEIVLNFDVAKLAAAGNIDLSALEFPPGYYGLQSGTSHLFVFVYLERVSDN